MSQHFADCLYGDSIAESDGSCKGVPCHVVGQVLCYLGFFCDLLEYDVTCAVIRNLRKLHFCKDLTAYKRLTTKNGQKTLTL